MLNKKYFAVIVFIGLMSLNAQVLKAPPRSEGEGPFQRLILRGGTLIDGTGSPAFGPVDIVIENNIITNIVKVGNPGVPIDPRRRPKAQEEDKELILDGMYILPGFVDMHGHCGGESQGTTAEYVFKLWMGHGITTVRDPGSGNGLQWTLDQKQKSAENTITAPRIYAYSFFGQDDPNPIFTEEQAKKWVQNISQKGADGIKFFGAPPKILKTALEEAKRLGLRTAMHHAQLGVTRTNVLHTASWGLTTMEHWYGLPEALFTEQTVQNYPADYNYMDEQFRFGEAGRLWKQAARKGSARWEEVMKQLLALDFTIVPTFNIYDASRDLMRARCEEWHQEYTLPALWKFFSPNRKAHGSFYFYWTTKDEIEWKHNYRLWMEFINDYKNHGGRVATGSDSGFIYKIYGFGYIRELELLQEAGFHPLEVIRSATLYGAQAIGVDDQVGSVEIGKLADIVVVAENPLENLKVLYGTGAIKVNEDNKPERVGGVKYTIKDGIIYDAKKLLADVREIVKQAKQQSGEEITQPGTK